MSMITRKLIILAISLSGMLHALDQPTSIPGKYRVTAQRFPSLESVIKRKPQSFPVYGIYSWMSEYRRLRSEIKEVGWKTLRISGPLSDTDLRMLFDDNVNFTYMVPSPGKRDNYASDDAYIKASVTRAKKFFDRYGRNGTFYRDNPKYKGRYIPYIMLRNEPNFHYMYKAGKAPQKQALYAKLAPQLIRIVKTQSPETRVIAFSTGGASAADVGFVRGVLKIEPKCITEADVFSTHPYIDPVPPDAYRVEGWGSWSIPHMLSGLRRTFAKHGKQNIPVWYTEGGWMISKAEGAAYSHPAHKVVPADLQAAYTCRLYALAVRLGVDCVTNMFITDTDGYSGGFFDRTRGNAWRPSAKAVQNMIRVMPHPALKGAQSDGQDGTFIYEFRSHARKRNSATVVMAYRIEGPKSVDIKVPFQSAVIVDMLGGERKVRVQGGSVKAEVGPLPIYVQGSGE